MLTIWSCQENCPKGGAGSANGSDSQADIVTDNEVQDDGHVLKKKVFKLLKVLSVLYARYDVVWFLVLRMWYLLDKINVFIFIIFFSSRWRFVRCKRKKNKVKK